MNSRERILMAILVTVVGGGALFFGVFFWFVKPLGQYNASIKLLNDDIDKRQFEIDKFNMERRKLVLARSKSLPTNAAEATNEYQRYLQYVMTYSGLAVEDITPSQAAKMKFQPTVPGIKEVGHQLMSFTVRARGDLKQLVSAMETMQTTPYEHRIKSLTIDRVDLLRDSKDANPRLHINMVVETLLVAKSDAKTGLPPGFTAKYVILDSLASRGGVPGGWGMLGSFVAIKASMPVPESRSYYQIAEKNIFTGPIPKIVEVREKTKKVVKDPPEPEPEPEPEPVGPYTPKYVYLTHTDPEQQTAYYRNRVFRSLEKRIDSNPKSGRQQFMIKDEEDEFVYVKGLVIRVDLRTVYFQKENKLYAWHIGTNLESALEKWLDIDQRDVLDLQINQEFAKAAADEEKAKTNKKTVPVRKGFTKGARN